MRLQPNKRLLLSRFERVVRNGRLAAPTRRDQVAAQQNREAVRLLVWQVSTPSVVQLLDARFRYGAPADGRIAVPGHMPVRQTL